MIDDAIELLNEHGVLSAPMLMRKFKLTFQEAIILLMDVVGTCTNVRIKRETLIYIEGRELDSWILKTKHKRKYQKKPSRWKDVTKP